MPSNRRAVAPLLLLVLMMLETKFAFVLPQTERGLDGNVVPMPTLPLLLMCRASMLFAQSPTVFVVEELTPFVCAPAGDAASESSSNASVNGGGENPVMQFRRVIILWPDTRHVEDRVALYCQTQ